MFVSLVCFLGQGFVEGLVDWSFLSLDFSWQARDIDALQCKVAVQETIHVSITVRCIVVALFRVEMIKS
jgi:hypothetical protein